MLCVETLYLQTLYLDVQLGPSTFMAHVKAYFLFLYMDLLTCNSCNSAAGNHYKIDFTMTKRKCQCLDHRIRKRDCKHIRLVLKALNIDDEPDKWKHATASLVEQQAAALKLDIKEEGKTEKCTTHWECKEGGGKNSGSKEHKVKHEPVSNT